AAVAVSDCRPFGCVQPTLAVDADHLGAVAHDRALIEQPEQLSLLQGITEKMKVKVAHPSARRRPSISSPGGGFFREFTAHNGKRQGIFEWPASGPPRRLQSIPAQYVQARPTWGLVALTPNHRPSSH